MAREEVPIQTFFKQIVLPFSPSRVPDMVAKTPKWKNQSLVGYLFWKIWEKSRNF